MSTALEGILYELVLWVVDLMLDMSRHTLSPRSRTHNQLFVSKMGWVKSHDTFHRRPSGILCRRQTKNVHGQECGEYRANSACRRGSGGINFFPCQLKSLVAHRSPLSDKKIHRCVLWQSIGVIILPRMIWCAIAVCGIHMAWDC
ncbi:hypothetical protein C8R48DRAFT_764778, partial [Suillus tomentosus]